MAKRIAACASESSMARSLGWRRLIDQIADSRAHRWLIPTAEVPLTNLVREAILDEASCRCASPPARRASAPRPARPGRDTRGMIRQHQFTKVELVSITTPEQSMDEHERMTRLRRGSAEAARPALPRHDAVHRRHGLRLAEDLRHRGLAAGPEHVSRNLVLLGLRRLPGAAHERALPRQGRQGQRLRPHAQRLRRRGRPRADRGDGEPTSRPTARSRCRTRCSPIWAA